MDRFRDVSGASSQGTNHCDVTPDSSPDSVHLQTFKFYSGMTSQRSSKLDLSSSLLFNSDGIAQLDLDDLELDLVKLEAGLSPFSTDIFDFTKPFSVSGQEAPALYSGADMEITSREESFIFPEWARATPEGIAQELSTANLDTMETEMARMRQVEKWACASSDITSKGSFNLFEGNLDFLSLEELLSSNGSQSGSTAQLSPRIDSSSLQTNGESPKTASPFDFSLASLGVDEIIGSNALTFHCAAPLNAAASHCADALALPTDNSGGAAWAMPLTQV